MKKTILEISKRSGCSPATVSNIWGRRKRRRHGGCVRGNRIVYAVAMGGCKGSGRRSQALPFAWRKTGSPLFGRGLGDSVIVGNKDADSPAPPGGGNRAEVTGEAGRAGKRLNIHTVSSTVRLSRPSWSGRFFVRTADLAVPSPLQP